MKKNSKEPAQYVDVILNSTLRGVTDAKGTCRFYGVAINEDDARPAEIDLYEVTSVKTEIVQ